MRKITKRDLSDNYFNLELKSLTVNLTSALNLSAILSGFSLGSVVALLFVDTSILVRSMFILSNISSCFFILTVFSFHGVLENVQYMIANLEFFETKKEKFIEFSKVSKAPRLGVLMLVSGIICFWSVLICSSFIFNLTFGIFMLIAFVPLLFYVFYKVIINTAEIEKFSLLEGKKSTFDGIPLDFDDIAE